MLKRRFTPGGLDRICEPLDESDVWLFDGGVLPQNGWRHETGPWLLLREEGTDPLPSDSTD